MMSLSLCLAAACSGKISGAGGGGSGSGGNNASGSGGGSGATSGGQGGSTGTGGYSMMVNPGMVTATDTPFDLKTATDSTRKVKNLLTGLPPTDDEIAAVTKSGAAGLQGLIDTWMTSSTTQPLFQSKMMFFFRNTFQQTSFTPTEDFKPQLLENGGFDFGPFGTAAVGDDAFARLVQNIQDSFALTAWQLIADGRPFTDVLTTQKYMMTTGLKSLYLQIEMPNDQPYAFGANNPTPLKWRIDYAAASIPLTDTLNPSSPNYMVFDDQPPATAAMGFPGNSSQFPTCHGSTTVTDMTAKTTGTSAPFTGYAQLFQRLIGYTPRYPFVASPECWEHPSKPIFTTQDLSDWQWVTVTQKASTDKYIQPYDLPTLRTTTTLPLALPRVGYFSTPAFLALWNTNDSNQHRVTANQALLVALGQSFTSEDTIVPLSTTGIDPSHAVAGTECYGCHKSLDPMRNLWANQLDFNDRNDWITRSFTGAKPNPKPTSTGGVFAFGSVNMMGNTLADFGTLVGMVVDDSQTDTINRFAMSITQKLCFFANSDTCDETDPEFRRIATAFQTGGYNFPSLIKEFFASPLVTGFVDTATYAKGTVPISISRRDHLCAALSNRLKVTDICAQAVPLPTQAQSATAKIAGSVAADAFSRGAQSPVTPSDPTLFYRSASEMLCENVATQVVDSTGANNVYSSSSYATSITGMVETIMGYTPMDTHHDMAVQILTDHYNAVIAAKNTATTALRSTFALACESPTALGIGL
jgi:hypothetical protein